MGCPRCGGEFTEYALGERRAVVCDSCGYVDVPAEHRGESPETETWEEALARFRERHRDRDERGVGREAPTVTLGGAAYRIAPDLLERFEGLTDKQRAIIGELLSEPEPMAPDRSLTEIADAADTTPGYVGDVIEEYGDVAAALASSGVEDAPGADGAA